MANLIAFTTIVMIFFTGLAITGIPLVEVIARLS